MMYTCGVRRCDLYDFVYFMHDMVITMYVLYIYMLVRNQNDGGKINGVMGHHRGCKRLICWHGVKMPHLTKVLYAVITQTVCK